MDRSDGGVSGSNLFAFSIRYSMMQRVVVCVAAGLIAMYAYVDNRVGFWPFAFAAIAIVFNPFIPFHLGRKIWFFVDIGAAAIFALHFWSLK